MAIQNKGPFTTPTLTAVPVCLEKNLAEMNIGYCFFVSSKVNGLDWRHSVPLNAMPVHYAAFTAGVIEQSNLEMNFRIGHYALWGAVDVLFAAGRLKSVLSGAYKSAVSAVGKLEKLLKPGEFEKLKKMYFERGPGLVGTEKYLDWQSVIQGSIRAIQTAFHGQYRKKALFYSLPFTKNICNDKKNRVIGTKH